MRKYTTIASRRQTILVAISLSAASSLLLALVWLLGGAPVTAAPAAELHVCLSGPPTCDYASVQAAVDAADPGDVIKVATGIYTGVQARAGITQVVYISKTVALRGGYTTADWDTPDPEANPTTLDAQGLGRVLVITGSITPTIEGLRITGGDATGLGGPGGDDGGGVYAYTATVTISRCVITNNTASTTGMGEGGGLYLDRSSSTLQNNTILSNTASTADRGSGGGLALGESAATLQGNTVQNNTASIDDDGFGGGLYLRNSAATLSGNLVQGNIASTADWGYGGGLYLYESDATLQDDTIINNTASTASGGRGGGLCFYYSNATLQSNTIVGNTAGTTGFGAGGGLFLQFGNNTTLQGNTIANNTASTGGEGRGGGLYSAKSLATLKSNTITNNTGSTTGMGEGGGLYLIAGDATLQNNTIVNNTASTASTGAGGGLYTSGSTRLQGNTIVNNTASTGSTGAGGGLYTSGYTHLQGNMIASNTATLSPTAVGEGGGLRMIGYLILINNLVAGNHANTAGSGLWLRVTSDRLLHNTIADNTGCGQGVYVDAHTTPAFTNTIIAGHSVGITVTAGSTVTLAGTLWYSNGTDAAGAGTIRKGWFNVYGDPAFVNPAAGDYHLGPGSAAIDAGVDAGVTEDIDGDPRFLPYDIGADEFAKHIYYLPMIRRDLQSTFFPQQVERKK